MMRHSLQVASWLSTAAIPRSSELPALQTLGDMGRKISARAQSVSDLKQVAADARGSHKFVNEAKINRGRPLSFAYLVTAGHGGS